MGIKRCPKCGSEKLLARKITGVHVESLENGEYKIKAEGKNYQIEVVGCACCKADFDESQLVEMVQCKKCGKFTEPENLDTNGECDVCKALQERPDLVNMSKEDLIRMMLKLERSTVNNTSLPNPQQFDYTKQQNKTDMTNVAEEKMKTAQAAISNVSNDFSKEILKETKTEQEEANEMVQDAMNPPEESDSNEPEKPRRGRRPRKKDDSEVVTEEVSQEQVSQSVNEMSNYQEAPFPEQDNEMKQMFSEPIASQEPVATQNNDVSYLDATVNNGATANFAMFEEEQSF